MRAGSSATVWTGITSMKRTNFAYYLREGVRSLFLHGFMSFAAVCVIAACLIIIGSFLLVLLNLDALIEDYAQDSEILAYVDESLSEAEARSVGTSINRIENVLNTQFVTRQEALEDFVSDYADTSLFDGLEASTFRDRYKVYLVDIAQIRDTVARLEEIPGVAEVSALYELAQGFMTLRNILNVVSVAILLILGVVSLLMISNTVRLALYDRRDEIAIMKIVGATNGFIRWPVVIEGFILGLLGAAAAFFLEWGLYNMVVARLVQADSIHILTELIPFVNVITPMAVAFGLVGLFVGVFGSLFSIRRFLKV